MSSDSSYSSGFKFRLGGFKELYGLIVTILRNYLPDKAKTAIRKIQYKYMYGFSLSKNQQIMIEKIKNYKIKRKIPIIVVDIPSKNQLLDKNLEPNVGTPEFLKLVDADFYFNYPKIAYSSASSYEIKSDYFPYDGHWNQKGSDKFAKFIVNKVSDIMILKEK